MRRFTSQPLGVPASMRRRGAGSLEFVLVLGVILPLVGIALPATRTMSQRVYEMTSTLISWPFL